MRWAMPKRYYFESTRRSRRGVLKKYLVRPTELKAAGGRFGPLLAWAREHLDTPLTVEMERMRRAFIRAFGQSPQSLRRVARAG